jgi:mxaD protein
MKKVLRLIVLASLMISTPIVFGHGPVRQKVVEKVQINAATDVVWNSLKNFGDMGWLPAVTSSDSANLPVSDGACKENARNERVWVGKGEDAESVTAECATRSLSLGNGQTIKEVIKKYSSKKMLYSYKIREMSTIKTITHSGEEVAIKALPVSNYSAIIMVKDNKDGGSQVIWKAGFYRGYMNNNPPAELTEEVAVEAVSAVFKQGLASLKNIVEGK